MSYIKPIYYDTLTPYQEIEHTGIEYNSCYDYSHISRYKGLRRIAHNPYDTDRFVTLETPNPIVANNLNFYSYEVKQAQENRLDLIAEEVYGSAQYSWILSYFNNIEDGFTVNAGQQLKVLKNMSSLFEKNELLASIPGMSLNLGVE